MSDLGSSMIRLMEQMLRLPVSVFAFALESFAHTLQGLDQGMERGFESGARPSHRAEPATQAAPVPPPMQTASNDPKEESHMADTNLNDDMAKLVEYSIVSIDRDLDDERKLLLSTEIVISENMTGDAFATWMIARFVQDEGLNFPHEKKKYLRVYYNVLQRWPQPDLEYEESQLHALRGIRRAIEELRVGPGNGNGNGGNPYPIPPGD